MHVLSLAEHVFSYRQKWKEIIHVIDSVMYILVIIPVY